MPRHPASWLPVILVAWAIPSAAGADDPADFFETRVRPLLVDRCQPCHGGEKTQGGLKLTSRAALLAGGENGPAAVAGKPDESLLIPAIRYQDEPPMPPTGTRPETRIA